jgi:hypothetical protein
LIVKRFFNRRSLAIAVLGFWALVLGWHIRREYFKPLAVRLAEGARSLAPGTFFYTVRMNEQAIGYAQTRLDTVPEGFVFNDRVVLDVPALNELHRAVTQTRIELGPALQLRKFAFQLGSEIGTFAVNGTMRPDSTLDLELNAGGKVQKSTLKLDPRLLLDAAVPMRLAAGGQLQVGQSFRTLVFDPSVMNERAIDLRVTAHDTIIVPDSSRWDGKQWVTAVYDTIPVWRIEQNFAGIVVGSWVDEDGQLVKADSQLGYSLERTTYEQADQDWKRAQKDGTLASGYGAIIERTAIGSNVDVASLAEADQLRVRLQGVPLQGFDLSGGRQTLRGDTLTVRREPEGALVATYKLPFSEPGDVARELESTPLIQSDDPAIQQMARSIANGSTDPGEVARRLHDWVYRELKKEITVSVPSALQVLQARQGDCNEHTVLYVALARALGLPARTASGLVNVRGRFYYHAWPEIWLGREWVAVDPTLGQFPADASHLRFVVGGLARQVELIRLIGRLQVDAL